MAMPDPLELLIEQEAAIDQMFAKIADEISDALSRQGDTVNVRATDNAVNKVLAKYFGADRESTLDSPLGRLIVRYANAGRGQALQDAARLIQPE